MYGSEAGCCGGGGGGFGFIRGIIGCACCCCCMGPLLLIIGLAMLFGENNYAENAAAYSARASAFAASGLKASVLSAKGNVNGYSLAASASTKPLSTEPSLLTGDGVPDGIQSVTLKASQKFSNFPVSAVIGSSASAGASGNSSGGSPSSSNSTSNTTQAPATTASGGFLISRQVTTKTASVSVKCPSSSRRSSGGDCLLSQLQSLCESKAGCSSARWRGTSRCNEGSTCSGCEYTQTQAASCTPIVAPATETGYWTRSEDKKSCIYPFSASDQPLKCQASSGGSSSAMDVVMMSEEDPFIEAQRITHGSMSLGLTEAQQRGIGTAMAVIGGLICAALVGMCVFIYKRFLSNDEGKAQLYGSMGRPYNGVMYQPGVPMQQAGYAPQPVAGQVHFPNSTNENQMYHAAPGYAQPGYGQPQPGYGQQPMMMVQPGIEGPPRSSPTGKAYMPQGGYGHQPMIML